MFCEHCGNKIQDGYKFCTKCGNSTTSNLSKNFSTSSKLTHNETWWIRLLKVLYIIIHLPLLLIIPLVWSANTESCYYSCSGSTGQAFWYSLLTLVIYIVIIRLIKLATMYIAMS